MVHLRSNSGRANVQLRAQYELKVDGVTLQLSDDIERSKDEILRSVRLVVALTWRSEFNLARRSLRVLTSSLRTKTSGKFGQVCPSSLLNGIETNICPISLNRLRKNGLRCRHQLVMLTIYVVEMEDKRQVPRFHGRHVSSVVAYVPILTLLKAVHDYFEQKFAEVHQETGKQHEDAWALRYLSKVACERFSTP